MLQIQKVKVKDSGICSIVIKPQFDYADDFSEGLARVDFSGKWGFIDHTRKFVIKPLFDHVLNFSGGLAKVCDAREFSDRF